MVLAPSMLNHIVLALEPFGALDAIELSETWEILGGFDLLVLSKMFRGAEIGMNEVEVPKSGTSINYLSLYLGQRGYSKNPSVICKGMY